MDLQMSLRVKYVIITNIFSVLVSVYINLYVHCCCCCFLLLYVHNERQTDVGPTVVGGALGSLPSPPPSPKSPVSPPQTKYICNVESQYKENTNCVILHFFKLLYNVFQEKKSCIYPYFYFYIQWVLYFDIMYQI